MNWSDLSAQFAVFGGVVGVASVYITLFTSTKISGAKDQILTQIEKKYESKEVLELKMENLRSDLTSRVRELEKDVARMQGLLGHAPPLPPLGESDVSEILSLLAILQGAFVGGMSLVAAIFYTRHPQHRHIAAVSISYTLLTFVGVQGIVVARIHVGSAMLWVYLVAFAFGDYALWRILRSTIKNGRNGGPGGS